MTQYRNKLKPVFIAILAFFALLLAGCGGLVTIETATPGSTAATNAATAVAATASPQQSAGPTKTPRATKAPTSIDGLQTISASNLPPEARHTLELIDNGGPFPYRNDGIVFQNREGILPKQRSGFYHEYTVVTPGASDRGARRIITGAGGEIYYTDDHYATFKRVIR